MGKLIACLLGVFGVYVSVCARQVPATAEKAKDEKCSLEGHVVNSVTGGAVRRAMLMLGTGDATSINIMRSTESDDKGRFVFRDVNPGRYVLHARRTGFVGQAYGAKPISRNPTLLVLSAGQQLKELLFNLVPNAVVSGRVLDSESEPMVGLNVTALRSVYQRGERVWLSRGSAQTNDLGEFRLADLAAGSYIVAAADPAFTLRSMLETSDNPRMSDVTTYYPDAADTEGAMPVQVGAGGETRLADIRMLRVPTVRVSGKVAGDSGGRRVSVRLVAKGGGDLALRLEKRADVRQTDGSFELRDVAPGSYTLTAALFFDSGTLLGAQPVQVGEQNVEGIVLQLSPRGDLSGVVAVEGRSQAKLESTGVLLRPRDYEVLSPPRGYADEAGKFTLKDVTAGRYLVEVFSGPEGSYAKSVRLGSREITGEGLDLTGGVAGSLQVTLSLDTAQVDGVVLDSENTPVAGATVVLVPGSRLYSLYREEFTDQYGGFSLKGIAPGDYELLAFEDIEAGAYRDPEFLKQYESKAESLSLKPNDRKSMQVEVIPVEQ